MSVKTYTTDTLCPKCEVTLYGELSERVSGEGGKYFEWECGCGALLEVEVDDIPVFSIKMKNPSVEN